MAAPVRRAGLVPHHFMNTNHHPITGIHHITAYAGAARRNLAFYRDTLGLRFVKKTVNFDDPSTYHLYFADRTGTPGTVYTTFPWGDLPARRAGTGEVAAHSYTIPSGSLAAWRERLAQRGVRTEATGQRFGDAVLSFLDDGGGAVELIESDRALRGVQPWTATVDAVNAIRGFHAPTLLVRQGAPTRVVLEKVLGFREVARDGARVRFAAGEGGPGREVDLIESDALPARPGPGSIHHIAFRVADDAAHNQVRETIVTSGLNVTKVVDRNYFHSIYFREPGGILFEVATDVPGFTVDEPEAELGQSLRLPAQYERHRAEIEAALPKLD